MDSPLAGLILVLASDMNTLKEVWLDVLEAAGCSVLSRLPVCSSRRMHYYLFLSVIVLCLSHGQ